MVVVCDFVLGTSRCQTRKSVNEAHYEAREGGWGPSIARKRGAEGRG